jgi:CubicO group peptidase (beta-lactamase class C family)
VTRVRVRGIVVVLAGLALAPARGALAKNPKPAPKRPDAPLSPLGQKIDEAVRRVGGAKLWGTALLAVKGEVVFAKGYGASDYRERPNDADTLFELASVTKQFTATAVLRLEQQKKLRTSDPIEKHLPGVPKGWKKVTIDHLLHHTAGIDPEAGVPYAWPGDREKYLEEMFRRPLVAEPGETFAYSNVGYALLAAIVETASKREFEDYVRKELFAPAGMTDSGFVRDPALVRSDRVTKRTCDDCQEGWTAADWWYGWGYRGMGGAVTTANDVLKWDRALRGEKVLGVAAKAKSTTPALEAYACGWRIARTPRGKPIATHSGGVRGYAIQVTRGLEDDFLVLFFSNGASDLFGVERAILEAAGI